MLSPRAGFFVRWGAFFAGLSVLLGAFAAHAMKGRFEESALSIFETGVRYQFFHALALILTGILVHLQNAKKAERAGFSFLVGILLFSGSLYAITFTGVKALGMITPLGGVLFIVGWGSLFFSLSEAPNR